MSEGSKREREERAADALLVSLLRRVDKDDDFIDPKHLPQLTEEEKAAMETLGSVARLSLAVDAFQLAPRQTGQSRERVDGSILRGQGLDHEEQ